MDTPPNYLIEIRLTTDSNLAKLIGLLVDTSEPFPEREREATPEQFVASTDPAERVYWITCRGVGDLEHPAFRHVPGNVCVACVDARREAADIDPLPEAVQDAAEASEQAPDDRDDIPAIPPMAKGANIHPAADHAKPKLPKASKRKARPKGEIPKGWLQPSSYAAEYKIKLATVYKQVSQDRVEHVKVNGSVYIKPLDAK